MNSPLRPERIVSLALPGSTEGFGLLSQPDQLQVRVGVLVIVGGPQSRVGAHRSFVQLARELAAHGVPCLRFDHRGIGDSGGPLQSFEALDEDIAAGIDALMHTAPELDGVVLFGLCDAASAALMYVARRRDGRVLGLALQNPWVRSPRSEARAQVQHYYWQRLRSADFWRKLMHGGIGLGALRGAVTALQRARGKAPAASETKSFQQLMADGWRQHLGPLLLQIAVPDLTAQEFLDTARREWPNWDRHPGLYRCDHSTAVHTFADPAHKALAIAQLVDWLHQHFGSQQK